MEIERIFDRPGTTWEPEERRFVLEWLYLPPQHARVLAFARRNLGRAATVEDAEDTWQTFSADLDRRVINPYDPARGKRFWAFLRYPCFQQYCWLRGKAIRGPVDAVPVSAAHGPDVPGSRSFEKSLIDRDALLTCLRMLDERCRHIIAMKYVEGRSGREIASAYEISEVYARVKLLRCVHQLRAYLRQNMSA